MIRIGKFIGDKLGQLVDSAQSRREAFIWGMVLGSSWMAACLIIGVLIEKAS